MDLSVSRTALRFLQGIIVRAPSYVTAFPSPAQHIGDSRQPEIQPEISKERRGRREGRLVVFRLVSLLSVAYNTVPNRNFVARNRNRSVFQRCCISCPTFLRRSAQSLQLLSTGSWVGVLVPGDGREDVTSWCVPNVVARWVGCWREYDGKRILGG
jgi:hypothetical protein